MKKVILIFIVLLFPFANAGKDLILDVNINRMNQNPSQNIVGNIFSYNITLFNPTGEKIDDFLTISVFGPREKILSESPEEYNLSKLSDGKVEIIIPYINKSLNNDTKIFPFFKEGTYKIQICAQKPGIRFVKQYEIEGGGSAHFYYSLCFDHYFSAMPKWQYELWKSQEEANQKIINISTETIEFNNKLTDYTLVLLVITSFLFLIQILTFLSMEKSKKILKGFMLFIFTTFLIVGGAFCLFYFGFFIYLFKTTGIGIGALFLSFTFFIYGIIIFYYLWNFYKQKKDSASKSQTS